MRSIKRIILSIMKGVLWRIMINFWSIIPSGLIAQNFDGGKV